ncbi:MAG TPA: acyl-CoA thioesterase [Flexivirga sp.]|uniref:acyl-CoA thioesterase n=1 Tax=Flexivirga sp. TaxID=1962927 RepID=UPI002BDA64CE|nr:acyl-CoA thioesterase [Flexivirga sp.]HWC24585.1 acyl-CoA thioesterase [Flexivirga sp.]
MTSSGIRAEHQTRIQWIDTDAAGIYHNSNVIRFVEAAEAELVAAHGLSGYFPSVPRVRYEVDYEAPLFFGQDVTAIVEISRIGTSSMTFQFELWGAPFDGRGRVRAARGRYTTVHVAGAHAGGAARATPWPAEWLRALGADSNASGTVENVRDDC